MRRDHRRAGASAAGLGETRAALPHAQTNLRGRTHFAKADIHLLGEQRIVFDARAEFFDRQGRHIIDEKDVVRVAHVDRHGAFQFFPRKGQGATVHGKRERNVLPVEFGFTHGNGYIVA
jgi:hypothetical protein